MSSSVENSALAASALVPEHSIPLMRAMSGGTPLRLGPYLFFHAEDWLMAVAYPLYGKYGPKEFETALEDARRQTGATVLFAIGATLPSAFEDRIVERDRYYVLGASAPIPARLRNPVKHAQDVLEVREGNVFTPAHRRLWSEFLEFRGSPRDMPRRVAELYARTPLALAEKGNSLRLLDAVDANGNLVACLLLDYAPDNFTSYILGAHSRRYYVPHAADLLFATMIQNARASGKRFIHLGLGVNDGILRFKLKWGARGALPYTFAQWQLDGSQARHSASPNMGHAVAAAFLQSGAYRNVRLADCSRSVKPFAMLWQVRKKDRVSWIGGTAHFFCHSFEPSFRKLFRHVDNVIFEGPLDSAFLGEVDRAGKTRDGNVPSLLELMKQEEISRLEKTVLGSGTMLDGILGHATNVNVDVRWLLGHARPWCAFFTMWTTFLERIGWHESVDMEAWNIARDMRRNVIAMENLDEQLESLGSLPVERVLRFFRNCGAWRGLARRNHHAYLAGDLEKMMGSSAEFPTRTEHVVGRRDQRFRERMRPYLEAGGAAVFVGTAHMVNLRHMLAEDGFSVRQSPFGIWPRIHGRWRQLARPGEKVTW